MCGDQGDNAIDAPRSGEPELQELGRGREARLMKGGTQGRLQRFRVAPTVFAP